MQRIVEKIAPFIFIGIALVAFGFGLIILAYLFLIGAVVGLILFMVNWIREQVLKKKQGQISKDSRTGRTIDSDDFKSM